MSIRLRTLAKGSRRRRARVAAFLLSLCLTGSPWALGQESTAQVYPLKHSAAAEVAGRMRSLLQETRSDVVVTADEQRNELLIRGSAESQKLVARMLATLDQPSSAGEAPQESAAQVQGYRVDGDLNATVDRLKQLYPAATGARIAADDRTRQVIVVAPAAVQAEIGRRLRAGDLSAQQAVQLSAPSSTPRRQPTPVAVNNQAHTLSNITWRDLEGELVRLWGDQIEVAKVRDGELVNVSLPGANGSQPIMQIDRQAGEVSFTGTARTISMWRTVVEAIDSPAERGGRLTQLVPIRNADPMMVQSTVSMLNQAAEQGDEQVTQSLPRTGANRKRNAADLVSMLYQQPPEGGKTGDAGAKPTPATTPANQPPAAPNAANPGAANPGAAAQPAAPGAAATGDEDTEGGLIGPVQIEILLDTIIIRGNKRDVARVKKIIEDIERLAETTRPIAEVYQMQHINGEAASTLINEVYTEILSERQGQVSIRPLGEPNAILLIGREESVKVVKDLITKIDQPSPAASKFEVFRLQFVSAVDAEATVRNFFVNRPGTDTNPRTGIGTRVQIISDFRTNALIVQASPRDLEEVRRLIQSIDVEGGEAKTELRIFKLKNALAQTLATVLQGAITGQSTTGNQQGQPQNQQGNQTGGTTQARDPSSTLEFMLIDQTGGSGKMLQSGILANVQVTADTNTNALIIRAPAKSMELIAALVSQLDRLPDANAQVKVFTIVNGNATSLAQMLQTLFGQQATAGQGNNQNALTGLLGLNNQLQTATSGGESSLVPLRFAIDQRTNSIIASGSESDLQVVETLLLRLDEDLDDRRLTVVRLRNTQASSVATAVQNYLQNLQQQVQTQLLSNQAISAFESVERQVFVVPENVTNSLIVSASPRYQEEILRVISDLDIRPPMVMVQVLIAEVTLNNTFEFGSEFGLQDSLVFDRGRAVNGAGLPAASSAGNPGFNFNSSPLGNYPNVNSFEQNKLAGQSLANFAVGRTNSTLGYSGLVLGAASDSISILLRALQDDGRLQILSRPQVMSMHNQPAYVQVGSDIARITGTNVTTGVVTQNVDDVPTGLILSILPLINDDGVIVMGIEAERSALGSEADGTPISNGAGGTINIRPITRTKASTTISARDGQTVVFAGLITKQDEMKLRRVPYLSDVPVLGKLFQYESNFEKRTELLIVMTPHLIKDEGDVEMIKMQESERMSWCLSDVVSVTGDWGLQGGHCAFCNGEAPVIFPDLDPTGSAVPEHALPSAPVPAVEDPQSSTEGGDSSRRDAHLAPIPVSTDAATIGPALPPSANREVAPAAYQPKAPLRRLPAAK